MGRVARADNGDRQFVIGRKVATHKQHWRGIREVFEPFGIRRRAMDHDFCIVILAPLQHLVYINVVMRCANRVYQFWSDTSNLS